MEPRRPLLARISLRLLAFNILLVFLPLAGFLYLGSFERQLLEQQERSMVQQGRLLAAALETRGEVTSASVEPILAHLDRRLEARLRVVDTAGKLVADTSRLGPRRDEEEAAAADSRADPRASVLYRLGALLTQLTRAVLGRPDARLASADFYDGADELGGEEIQAALAGRYGAVTRLSAGQRSVTLYSAIPVRDGERVMGAVLVSRSTVRILEGLYRVRLDIFKVFLASVAVAVLLSILFAGTIARPLERLRQEAAGIVDQRGRLTGRFSGSTRPDEIGDLARALQHLTRRLERHAAFIESFASDLAHELKNPLASIRTAGELLLEVEEPAERLRFLEMVLHDVARMERLLSGASELSRLDAGIAGGDARSIDLSTLARDIVEGYRLRRNGELTLDLLGTAEPLPAAVEADHASQILTNLLDNAVGFSPAGSAVTVELARRDGDVEVAVRDQGPGIPPGQEERIFERFYSFRPGPEEESDHLGLGLAIVRTIVEGYGGTVRARRPESGGTELVVRLPAAR